MSRLISWVGRPTAVRISSMVTRPALGMLAAPTLANVAVILGWQEQKTKHFQREWKCEEVSGKEEIMKKKSRRMVWR